MKDKEEILDTIAQIIHSLVEGNLSSIDPLLDLLKTQTISLKDLQEEVLDFIQQVEFQKDYDPQHLITENIQKAADILIKSIQKPK
jgi:hypothetical protein